MPSLISPVLLGRFLESVFDGVPLHEALIPQRTADGYSLHLRGYLQPSLHVSLSEMQEFVRRLDLPPENESCSP